MSVHEDRQWPRAKDWLEGVFLPEARGLLRVLGAPVTLGSITPCRCDLAPQAMRDALRPYSTYDVAHARDLRALRVEDWGDLPLAQSSIVEAQRPIQAAVQRALAGADALVLLGGNNSITRPVLHGMNAHTWRLGGALSGAGARPPARVVAAGRGRREAKTGLCSERRPCLLQQCGLLTLDAHLDLRALEGGLSNGNPTRALLADGLPGANIVQIGIQSFANSMDYFQVAKENGIQVVPVEQVAEEGVETVVTRALGELAQKVAAIYVDLDLDVMDSAFAPATAGARPGGLTPLNIRRAAYCCGAHPKVRVMDLVEADPSRDRNGITALAAAACLLAFASGVLARGQ